jgi:hypothetical protein
VIVPKSEVETVHGDCDERVSEVSVRVVAFHTSVANAPNEVRVRELYPQIEVGSVDASDELAVNTVLLVFVFTALVPAVIAEARELVAVVTSDNVANDPDVNPAPVKVLVAALQISEATALNEESVRAL